MGSVLGNIIRDHEGKEIFQKVEIMRSLAKVWQKAGDGHDKSKAAEAEESFTLLVAFLLYLSNKELIVVSQAFTHFLSLANAAKAHHQTRLLRKSVATLPAPLLDKADLCGVISDLVSKYSAKVVFVALTTQLVELVQTAHPKEVNQTTILDKQCRVQQLLTLADDEKVSELNNSLTSVLRNLIDIQSELPKTIPVPK